MFLASPFIDNFDGYKRGKNSFDFQESLLFGLRQILPDNTVFIFEKTYRHLF